MIFLAIFGKYTNITYNFRPQLNKSSKEQTND